jgi:hypothetical protein
MIKTPIFVENVTILPGTDDRGEGRTLKQIQLVGQ